MNQIKIFNLQWRNSWWQCQYSIIPNAETPPKLNLNGGLLSNIGSELKCCINNKWINRILPTSATISMTMIQIPSAPIKPREDLDHHQVVTWTLKWTSWIQTTEKLITIKFWYSRNMKIYQLPKLFPLWIYSDKEVKK